MRRSCSPFTLAVSRHTAGSSAMMNQKVGSGNSWNMPSRSVVIGRRGHARNLSECRTVDAKTANGRPSFSSILGNSLNEKNKVQDGSRNHESGEPQLVHQ